MAEYVIAVLRVNPQLTWVSYGDRDDSFVGARRDEAGQLYLNRSFPRGARIRLEEDWVLPDGRRKRARTVDDHRYRPREQAYFKQAADRRDLVWTEPYRYYEGALGVSCAVPLLDAAGGVRGVFTVDLSLNGLSRFVEDQRVSSRGRVFIATGEGALVAAPGGVAAGEAAREDAVLVAEVVRHMRAGHVSGHAFDRAGERYVGRAAAFTIGDRQWITAAVVPERDYTATIDAQAWRAGGLGFLALLPRSREASRSCAGSPNPSGSWARRRAGSGRVTSRSPSSRGAATRSGRWPEPWPRWCRDSEIATSSGTSSGAT
jgi:hypothetical protein